MSQDMAAAIQAIASVINLILVIGFFIVERRSGRENIQKDKKEFWYRQTILERGLDTLNKSFTQIDNILQNANKYNTEISDKNERYIRELINEVKTQIFVMKREVLVYTKLFDCIFYKSIKESMENLEDSVTVGIEECYLAREDTGDILYELNNYKYKILSELYKYDMDKSLKRKIPGLRLHEILIKKIKQN